MTISIQGYPVVVINRDVASLLADLDEDPRQFNCVEWPAGASKWATARFLITKATSDALKALSREAAVTLTLSDGVNPALVFDQLYQLPHRPVHVRAAGAEIKDALYELTLVDVRYFWRSTCSTAATDLTYSFGTWQVLLEEMLSQLGVSSTTDVNLDPISTGESVPWDFLNPWEPLSVQVDRVCAQLGIVFVAGRTLNTSGKRYYINTPSQFNDDASGFSAASGADAGGEIYTAASEDGKKWLDAVMPSQVFVVFPRSTPGDALTPPVTGAPSLNEDQYSVYTSTNGKPSGVSGRSGMTAVLHDSMYAMGTIGAETNQSDLQARANYLARRFYNRFRIANAKARYDGWTDPGSFPGTIWWKQTPTAIFTRVEVDSNWDLYGGTSDVVDGFRHKRVVGIDGTQVIKTYDGGLLIRGGGGPIRLRVKEEFNDYLRCRTWDGSNEGSTNIYVAKPVLLRHTLSLYPQLSGLTTSDVDEVSATDGTDTETWLVTHSYYTDTEIWAIPDATGLVDGDTNPIVLVDDNRNARIWAVET